MGKFAVISIALLLFAGCGPIYTLSTLRDTKFMPIDEALVYANHESEIEELYKQWRKQSPYKGYEEDGKKIERKREEIRKLQYEEYYEARRREEEYDRKFFAPEAARKEECERLKKGWAEFIQSCDGSLRNKTTQEVKKLVDQWKYVGVCSGKEEFW
jgi:hypothetical protein